MSNLAVKNAAGSTVYLKQSGAGSDVDPHIPEHTISGTVAVTGPVTDAQLRAADVPVTLDGESVAVTGTFYQATQPVSGPLTDTQLRASAVPITVAPAATIVHGQKTVTTAGTEEALGASTALSSGVRIKALHANTGFVYVGANPVTSSTGFVLDAGEEVFLEVANLATVYIDVSVNGEGVSYLGG